MDRNSHIFISSVGRRCSLIECFKTELQGRGKVIAGDMSLSAPALYCADEFVILPPSNQPGFIDKIVGACEKYDVHAILSLTDYELTELSRHQKSLEDMGILYTGPGYDTAVVALDKFKLYQFCNENGFQAPVTYTSYEAFNRAYERKEIAFPVFLKPRFGSASEGIDVGYSEAALQAAFSEQEDMIAQQMFQGTEYGIDVYVDLLSEEPVSIFIKEKLKMRAGETDKAVSVKIPKVFDIIYRFAKAIGLRGQNDIDLFEYNGEYYITDLNPRFGGGYPLCHGCGCNFVKYIINNMDGKANIPEIGNYREGVVMMKYESTVLKDKSQLEAF